MNGELDPNAMSEAYWKLWNPAEQQRIDRDIEAHRKADAEVELGVAPGTEVSVEQLSHEFVFGSHIFNFDQLGSTECNEKYKALFGTLFNSATIAFYWYSFEPEEGKLRYQATESDSAEFWNRCPDPKNQFHWRRPPADPVVEFCEARGIRRHGHTLTWGNGTWQYPRWELAKLPKEYLVQLLTDTRNGTNFMSRTPAEIAAMIPAYAEELNRLMVKRIRELAAHYGNRIQSWDVVNESATDFEQGRMIPGDRICKSTYGLMPGDYAWASFQEAQQVFPPEVKLNINDYNLRQCYPDQVCDLQRRNCKIDIMGAQMHLFDPQTCLDIAEGRSLCQSPAEVRENMARIGAAGLPIHLSEITITSPLRNERGQVIQATIARNLYRLWFSLKPMMGITWWNVVDDCGAPGEPSVSGLFTREMKPKRSFYALDSLINHEWKTRLECRADRDGRIAFRGFRGSYRLRWRSADGIGQSRLIELK